MEFDTNYSNMVQCLIDSGGDYEEAQDLYRIRYGTEMTATDVLEKARNYYRSNRKETTCNKKPLTDNSINKKEEYGIIIKKELKDSDSEEEIAAPEINSADNVFRVEEIAPTEINPTENELIASLENHPIVYTTRLDDMLIFKKNFRRLDVDDVIKSILSESKPPFNNGMLDEKNNMIRRQYIINPFFKLVENIRELNEMANTVSFGDFDDTNTILHLKPKSKKLLEQCKPLSVLLVDCKIQKGTTVILNSNSNQANENTISDKRDLKTFRPEQNYEPVTVSQVAKLRKSIFNCLIFINLKVRTTDIIYINKATVPTAIFTVNHVLTKDEMPPNSLIMKNCCWFGREECINGIIGWSKYKQNNDIILKTKHGCPPNMCSCCCKKKISNIENDDLSSTEPQYNSSFRSDVSSLLTNQLNKEQLEGSISKALRYNRNKSNDIDPIKPSKKQENVLEIEFSNAHTNMVESYYIEQHGKKNKNIEMNAMNSVDFLRFFNNTPFLKMEMVCCWYRRYWLLRESQSLNPHHKTNFIRTPHTCPVDDCKCCCKNKISPQKLISLPPASKIPWLKNLSSAKNYMNKTFQRMKQLRKMVNKSDETRKVLHVTKVRMSNVTTVGNVQENTSAPTKTILGQKLLSPIQPAEPSTSTATSGTSSKLNLQTSDQQNKIIRPNKPVKAAVTNKKQNATTSEMPKKKNKVIPGNTTVPGKTTEPAKSIIPGITVGPGNTFVLGDTTVPNLTLPTTPSIPAGGGPLGNMDPTVNSLVQSILGRFQDVRLTINAEGEVSAELNTPIENLSTSELKILSAILSHAKEQVKALKLHPEMTNSVMSMFSNTSGASNTPLIRSLFPNASLPNNGNVNASLPNNGNVNASAPPILIFEVPDTSALCPQVAGPSNIPSYDSSLSNSNTPPGTPFESNIQYNVSFDPVKTGINPFQCYTNLNALKAKQYELSCKAFITKRVSASVPQIQNVYSLNKDTNTISRFVNKRKVPISCNVPPKRSKAELIPASIPVETPSTSQQVPMITVLPQPAGRPAGCDMRRLQDLIAIPFVPPNKPPPLAVNGTINPTAELVSSTQELPNVDEMPNLVVGPAISILQTNNNSDKTEEECILGF